MDRSMIVSLSLAAALHAGLLFGFQRGPVPARVAVVTKDFVPISTFAAVEPPEPIDVILCGGDSKPVAARPAPRGFDDSLPDPHGSWPAVPKLPPVNVEGSIDKVPVNIDLPPGMGEGGGGLVIDPSRLDNPPKTRTQSAPMYPFDATQRGLTGKVVVEFIVDESGRVLDPHIVSSSNRVFEEATLRAVSKWRFEPGRKNGRTVRFRMALPVEFDLSGN